MTEVVTLAVNIRTVLFDLDGTLADTAPDLALALNTLLKEEGKQPLSYERIRQEASYGGKALITLGFGLEPTSPQFEPLRQRFLNLYKSKLCEHTTLFKGMDKVINDIESAGLNWGIVTNKPSWLTDPLLKLMGLENKASAIVSGDTTNNSKPHPGPLLHACETAGSQPGQCLYVGDAERDIEAGQRAGMKTLVALFGYLRDDDQPENWGADGLVNTPEEILSWLNEHQ
ncbi:MAG: HAD family hydrolase [Acidiferrobacterales bacterium]